MRKFLLTALICTAFCSGCSSNDTSSEHNELESAFREGYFEGYNEGLMKFQNEFDEEIAPAYDYLQESYIFYAENVCILSPDKTYHTYCGCWDCPEEPFDMMFRKDAEALGYKKCPSCYEQLEMAYMPDYETLVENYEPDCPAYTK